MPTALEYAQQIDDLLGHLHNIGAHTDVTLARRAYLDAKRAVQKARCDNRRSKNITNSLMDLALNSKKLCDLAESANQHPNVVFNARQSINAMDSVLKSMV